MLLVLARLDYLRVLRGEQERQVDETALFLQKHRAFRNTAIEYLRSFANYCGHEHLQRGSIVLREGDSVARLCIIRKGCCRLRQKRRLLRLQRHPRTGQIIGPEDREELGRKRHEAFSIESADEGPLSRVTRVDSSLSQTDRYKEIASAFLLSGNTLKVERAPKESTPVPRQEIQTRNALMKEGIYRFERACQDVMDSSQSTQNISAITKDRAQVHSLSLDILVRWIDSVWSGKI